MYPIVVQILIIYLPFDFFCRALLSAKSKWHFLNHKLYNPKSELDLQIKVFGA